MKTTALLSPLRHGALLSALAIVGFVHVAHADPDTKKTSAPPRPAGTAKQRAEQHLQAGNAAFEKQDYAQAVTELEASYAEVPNPAVLYALGQAHRLNGNCAEAVAFYRKFIDSNPTAKQKEAATGNIERCEPATPVAAAPVPEPAPAKAEPVAEERPPQSDATKDSAFADSSPPKSKAFYEDVAGDILAGTGIAAAAVGTVLFLGGRSKVNDADDVSSQTAFNANRADADSGESQQTIGLVVLGAGGALLTAGIIRWATVGGGEKDAAHVRIGPTWGGVMATGAF